MWARATYRGPVASGGALQRARGGGAIAVAMGMMNVASYAYTIVAARLLGPRDYGAFAALMGVLLVVMVLSLALQATAARRIASAPHDVAEIERVILRVGIQASLGLGLVCLALSPLISLALRLDSVPTAALTAAAAVPMTLMGAQAGILQGERRWLPLAVLYLAVGVPRLVVGTALIIWQPDEFSALLGVVLAAFAPVLVGRWALGRHPRPGADRDAPPTMAAEHSPAALWRETVHNSNALLAFFALSNIDILVARNVLDEHQAGLYAGGLILSKAVLFLPQFVVVLAFPSMSSGPTARPALYRSLAVVLVVGLVTAAGTAVLSGLAVVFVGGAQYSEIRDQLWLYALLGTVLSLLQLLVYNVLARQARRAVVLVWVALVLVAALGQLTDSYGGLLALVLVVDSSLLLVLLVVDLLRRRPAEETADDTDGAVGSEHSVGGGVPAGPGADGDVERNRQLGR